MFHILDIGCEKSENSPNNLEGWNQDVGSAKSVSCFVKALGEMKYIPDSGKENI